MTKGKNAEAAPADAKPVEAVAAPQSEVQRKCHDLPFALLFLLAFGLTVALACAYGGDVLSYSVDSDKYSTVENVVTTSKAKYKYALRICACIAAGALVASIVWTLIMLVCGKMLIWISVLFICALSIGAGYTSSYFLKQQNETAYWWPAAVTLVFVMLVLLYVCCIRNRIAFASANLQVACRSVLSYPVILLIAVLFTLVQIGWALVWIIATYAAINHGEYIGQGEGYSTGKKFGILVGMVLIFFWATCVCRNIVMVSTAGTVSSWWHHSSQDRQSLTSTRALCRALTLSFGSICFGSLIVSIIQTIQFILSCWQQALKGQGNAVAACLVGCIGCLVGCVEKCVEYFNRFAYSYVGIYGYGFVGSGKRVFQLFASKGWSAIMNDSLIGNVLLFGKIVVGFLGAAAGWGCVVYGDDAWTARVSHPEAALGISGFLIGYSVADVIMTVIDGAVATIFILFAEDPYALTSSHPTAHESLHKTWKEIYPDEYERSIKRPDEHV